MTIRIESKLFASRRTESRMFRKKYVCTFHEDSEQQTNFIFFS